MTKQILSVGAGILLLAPTTFAQKSKLQEALRGPLTAQQQRLLDAALQAVIPTAAGKTAAQTQRLIGYSNVWVGGGNTLTDSARITYNSTTRGSNHAPNNLSSYTFFFNPNNQYFPRVEDFFETGEIRIKADTVVMLDEDGVYQGVGLTYDAANRLTQMRNTYYSGGVFGGRERYALTYDGAGQRTQLAYDVDTSSTGTPGVFQNDYVQYSFFGSPTGRILRDSVAPAANAPFTTDPARTVYTYTGNNITQFSYFYFSGSAFEEAQRVTFTYDASNRVRVLELLLDQGNGIESFIKDSLVYTGANLFPTRYDLYVNNGVSYDLVQSARYTINAQNLRDTVRIYDGGNDLVYLAAYNYNSYGNPTGYRGFDPSVSTTTPDEIARYHYELYDPSGVEKKTLPGIAAAAYPNPVTDAATLTWSVRTGNVSIQLTDAAGRLLETLRTPAAPGSFRMDMSRHTPGIYYISLRGEDGATQSLKVTKQ